MSYQLMLPDVRKVQWLGLDWECSFAFEFCPIQKTSWVVLNRGSTDVDLIGVPALYIVNIVETLINVTMVVVGVVFIIHYSKRVG